MASRLARRIPGGKVHHIVGADDRTACGFSTAVPGWAVWPLALNPRVDLTPLCAGCREATQ